MLIELGKKYKTVSGLSVEITKINDPKLGLGYPVLGLIQASDGCWHNRSWTLNGEHAIGSETTRDLVEVPNFEVTTVYDHIRPYRRVEYFGLNLSVPDNMKYITTDVNGSVYGYPNKPNLIEKIDYIRWTYEHGRVLLAKIEFKGDWKESLMNVREE